MSTYILSLGLGKVVDEMVNNCKQGINYFFCVIKGNKESQLSQVSTTLRIALQTTPRYLIIRFGDKLASEDIWRDSLAAPLVSNNYRPGSDTIWSGA